MVLHYHPRYESLDRSDPELSGSVWLYILHVVYANNIKYETNGFITHGTRLSKQQIIAEKELKLRMGMLPSFLKMIAFSCVGWLTV